MLHLYPISWVQWLPHQILDNDKSIKSFLLAFLNNFIKLKQCVTASPKTYLVKLLGILWAHQFVRPYLCISRYPFLSCIAFQHVNKYGGIKMEGGGTIYWTWTKASWGLQAMEIQVLPSGCNLPAEGILGQGTLFILGDFNIVF